MLGNFGVAYFLGAFTFWPLVAVIGFVGYTRFYLPNQSANEAEEEANERDNERAARYKPFTAPHFTKLNAQFNSIGPDFESDVEASCWLRLSPSYIASSDPYEDPEAQTKAKSPPSSARTSLQKLMAGSSLFGRPAPSSSSTDTTTAASTEEKSPLVSKDNLKPKSVAKCPRYWAVVRGGQLQLFEDQLERKFVEFITIPHFVVSLWPQDLQEFELFYRRYPIMLLNRTAPEGLVSLDLYPGRPPKDAFYLYIANPTEKEDLYFALIKASQGDAGVSSPSPSTKENHEESEQSLGPRDPKTMARPILNRKAECQQLQSSIWNSELSQESQWLNALLGRIFLGLKESKHADDYLRRKFATKLKPISDSSNIIGDIEVKDIRGGSAAPFLSNFKLRELSTDGNLKLSANVSYKGGFKVILATSVKLAAVTSLTTVEIPIELAATLRGLSGTVLVQIKPAPSERIWYAFETMPEVDLHIEPAVYDTHISLSVVTKFIRSKILDSLKETLVMPYMDDICFYETTDQFYRGGIWESPVKLTATNRASKASTNSKVPAAKVAAAAATAKVAAKAAETNKRPVHEDKSLQASDSAQASSPDSAQASSPALTPSASVNSGSPASQEDADRLSVNSLAPPQPAPRIRTRVPSVHDLDGDSDAASTISAASVSSASTSTVQRLSNWVKKRRAPKDTSTTTEAAIASVDHHPDGYYDSPDPTNMSPRSVRSRAASTTQVTAANVSINGSPGRKQAAKRKPVPTSSLEEEPVTASSATSDVNTSSSSGGGSNGSAVESGTDKSVVADSAGDYAAVDSTVVPEVDSKRDSSSFDSAKLTQNSEEPSTHTVSYDNANHRRDSAAVDYSVAENKPRTKSDAASVSSSIHSRLKESAIDSEFPELSRPAFHKKTAPSIGTSSEISTGITSMEPGALSRRSSFSSFHSKRSSVQDTGSIRSNSSTKNPPLPPRQRRLVPLSNVPPERSLD